MAFFHIKIIHDNGYIWEYPIRYTLKYIEKVILENNDWLTVQLWRIKKP
jgi:hypothetical protein